jgi:hypothetical protein
VLGQIVLFYDLYSVDPSSASFDPLLDTISLGNFVTAPASVTVGTVLTPEPRLIELLVIGGIVMVLFIAKQSLMPRS